MIFLSPVPTLETACNSPTSQASPQRIYIPCCVGGCTYVQPANPVSRSISHVTQRSRALPATHFTKTHSALKDTNCLTTFFFSLNRSKRRRRRRRGGSLSPAWRLLGPFAGSCRLCSLISASCQSEGSMLGLSSVPFRVPDSIWLFIANTSCSSQTPLSQRSFTC